MKLSIKHQQKVASKILGMLEGDKYFSKGYHHGIRDTKFTNNKGE